MPIPACIAFLFTADCYGQPLRIQYVDGALWFVQADLQAVLRMRLRAPLETVPDADGLWKFERLAGVEEALLDERALAAILGYAQGLPAVSRFAAWLSAQLPRQVRAALAEHRASVASQPTLPPVVTPSPAAPLSISDTAIRRDAEGRFCLNDLHKAAGDKRSDKPANFLRSDEAQRLVSALEEENSTSQNRAIKPIQSLAGAPSTGGGTYVVKELVYAYAMWISPTFHLRVIRAFDALVSGQTLAAAPPARPPLLPDAELFFALQLAFPSSTSSALLLWTLIRLDAHRRALHSNARELHRQMGGAMDRPQINRTAKKLAGEGLMEFRPGCYRVLGEPLAQTLAEVLDTYRPVLDALRTVVPTLEEVAADRLGLLLSSSRLH